MARASTGSTPGFTRAQPVSLGSAAGELSDDGERRAERVVEVVNLDHGRDGTRTLGLCVQPSVIAATSSELGSSFHPYPARKDSCGFRRGILR